MDHPPPPIGFFYFLLYCMYVKKKKDFLDINWQAKVHKAFLIHDQQFTKVGLRI